MGYPRVSKLPGRRCVSRHVLFCAMMPSGIERHGAHNDPEPYSDQRTVCLKLQPVYSQC
jgi:hypothetical protein